MNLAEIRKKAQREAQEETAFAPQQAPQDFREAPFESLIEPEWAPQSPVTPQPQSPPQQMQQPVQPQAVPVQQQGAVQAQQAYYPSRPAAEVLELASDYDPLELILKGREKAAAAAEEDDQEQGAATLELLCFKISTEEYAISIMDLKEIIKPREVTEVPRTPPFVSGIISLRGIIIPVFDLRVRLGLPPQEATRKERIVVVKRQDGFCGILVDQVVQVVRIGIGSIEPPPAVLEGIDRDFVHGIGRVDGRMLILLNMEKVLDVALS